MRVLVTSSPGWGHVHPMVPLAAAFAQRGDEVLWCVSPEVCPELERQGFRCTPGGLTQAESHRRFDQRFPEFVAVPPEGRGAFMFRRLFGAVRAGPMLRDLTPVGESFQPDVIVHEAGEAAAPIVAALLGVPNVTHGFGALVPEERVAGLGAEVAPLWRDAGLEPRPYGGCYDDLYLDIYPPSLSPGGAAHVPSVQPLRPVPFAVPGSEPLPSVVTAEDDRPLVYVTLGTVFNEDVGLFATIAGALGSMEVRALVTVGPEGDPASLGHLPANVQVARYIPQTELLPHVSVVVSHAGSGTFLAAAGHAIPQLCIPQAADQFANAAAGRRAGVALTLDGRRLLGEEVAAAVEQLLKDGSYRRCAERVASEIQAMPGPGEVAEVIASLVGSRAD